MSDRKDSQEIKSLIQAAQKGDEQAFEKLLDMLQTPIYRLAFSMLHHKQNAEDAAQEVLIKLWRTLPDYRFECPILPYVLKMTRTTVLDMQRKLTRRHAHETSLTVDGDDGERVVMDVVDTSTASDPVAALAREELIAEVRRAIDDLPPDDRDIIILKDLRGLSYESIAHVLAMEEGTVASRLSRARKKLKNLLKTRKIF